MRHSCGILACSACVRPMDDSTCPRICLCATADEARAAALLLRQGHQRASRPTKDTLKPALSTGWGCDRGYRAFRPTNTNTNAHLCALKALQFVFGLSSLRKPRTRGCTGGQWCALQWQCRKGCDGEAFCSCWHTHTSELRGGERQRLPSRLGDWDSDLGNLMI